MAVSSTAEIFTSLFNTFLVLAIIVGAVVFGIMIYLIVRYREKESVPEPEDAPTPGVVPRARGKPKTILISVSLSTIVLLFLIVGTFGAIDTLSTPPEQGTIRIKVTGFQWAWKFVYPNGYEKVGELRVPVGEVVILYVTSTDVFHNFGIIDFKIKTDAIPGRTNTIWFVANEPGEYTAQCFEFCGLGHAFMKAQVIVMEPKEFEVWYSALKVK